MRIYRISIFILMTVLLFACNTKTKQLETNKLSGLWSLYIMEQQDSITGEWREWRNGMQGYILYDDNNHMSLHLTTKGYQNTNLEFPNFTDTVSIDALKHLTKSYVYFAKYTVFEEDSIVEHARISHSNPGEWNDIVKRRFSFVGDTLILRPVEKQKSGLRLKWLKKNK